MLLLVSSRWGWEPTRLSLLWRTATSGSPRRSSSHRHAATSHRGSSPDCHKELFSTRLSSTSCHSNRRASSNWWIWSKTDRTGLEIGYSSFLYSRGGLHQIGTTCNLMEFTVWVSVFDQGDLPSDRDHETSCNAGLKLLTHALTD